MRGRLSQLHPFHGRCRPLGEGATLGKAGGEMPTREDRDESLHCDALREVGLLGTGYVRAEARDRLGIVPPAPIGEAQIVPGRHREGGIPHGGRQGHGPVPRLEGAFERADRHKMHHEIRRDTPEAVGIAQGLREGRGVL